MNGAQFLNITPLSLSSNHFALSPARSTSIDIVPLACIYDLKVYTA